MAEIFMIGNGLKPCVEHPELPKGTIIYSFGAGMWEEKWAKIGQKTAFLGYFWRF